MRPGGPPGPAEAETVAEVFARLDGKPTTAQIVRAVRDLERLSAGTERFERRKVVMVRNFTIEPVEPHLKLAAYRRGISLAATYSGYQPTPGRELAALLTPDVDAVVVCLRIEQLAPILAAGFHDERGEPRADAAEGVVEAVAALVRAVRSESGAAVLLCNFVPPLRPAGGIGDAQRADGQANLVRSMNLRLARVAEQTDHCHLVDVEHAFAEIGLRNCYDQRGDRLSGAPLTVEALKKLADTLARHIRALAGPAYKCIAVDCDNTLWGGVVGEDGVTGIALGDSGPGARYQEFQRQLLNLRRRGALLAICSKNEARDVKEVLNSHPDCLLSVADFASMRVDWGDKVENLRSIAAELNIGLQHLVFIDDDPMHCQAVRVRLPEVRVLQYPDDIPVPGGIEDLELFDSLVVTDEDRNRTEMYRAEMLRQQTARGLPDARDFLRSLSLVATVGRPGPEHLGRMAQLTQRTNQFNLTTRRYEVGDLAELARDGSVRMLWMELSDRFGGYGIVGCVILRLDGSVALIDTLLLSCRVLGRDAETVLVHKAAAAAAEAGADLLVGEYLPTERNGQVAELYGRLGFSGPAGGPDGTRWEWPLSRGVPPVAEWIEVIDMEEAARC